MTFLGNHSHCVFVVIIITKYYYTETKMYDEEFYMMLFCFQIFENFSESVPYDISFVICCTQSSIKYIFDSVAAHTFLRRFCLCIYIFIFVKQAQEVFYLPGYRFLLCHQEYRFSDSFQIVKSFLLMRKVHAVLFSF